MAHGHARAQALLDLWFGTPAEAFHDRPRGIWFTVDPAFDALLRGEFLADHERAHRGELNHWRAQAPSCLALVLLLDQIPRNLWRGTARAYASDAAAREVVRDAMARGYLGELPPVRAQFLCLPLEHSEALADQDLAVALFEQLASVPASEVDVGPARQHRAVIARFGRFPQRNAILGRASTDAEEAFLQAPGTPSWGTSPPVKPA